MPHFFYFQDLLNITQGRTESLYRVETCRSIRRSPWEGRQSGRRGLNLRHLQVQTAL